MKSANTKCQWMKKKMNSMLKESIRREIRLKNRMKKQANKNRKQTLCLVLFCFVFDFLLLRRSCAHTNILHYSKWLRRTHLQSDRWARDSCLDTGRMSANWLSHREHLLMWAYTNVAPNRLEHPQPNTSLAMARSFSLRSLFVDFESIGSLASSWQSIHRCDFGGSHQSNTRMRPSNRDCSSARQHGNRDLISCIHTFAVAKIKLKQKQKQMKWI